jgi:phosphatidylserine decarboxylase
MIPYKDISKIVHKDGYPIIILSFVVSFFLLSINSTLGFFSIAITVFVIYFFRDPIRQVPVLENYILSPADGIVQNIVQAMPPEELNIKEDMIRVSIFLNVFNVHVNRVPISGIIKNLIYHPGKFLNASLDKASVDNERQTVLLELKDGREIIFTQIAGLIAKRIVCDLEINQEVEAGDKFGIIRFGSRMDVFLPLDAKIHVSIGQIVIGGETLIANLGNQNGVDYPILFKAK